ncbi:MAG TPA: alpha-L-fucosidase [Opitutaceae bacterium]|nr:alpha-L-fucosidase [Opitutaceae bacterium]
MFLRRPLLAVGIYALLLLPALPSRAADVPPPGHDWDHPAVPPGLHSLKEPDPARDARVAWHKEARFGCFMHWGVYSRIGGVWPGVKSGTYSEHLMRWAKIPRAVYLEKVVKPFDPEKFDADTWVRLLRDTGMRYLIITAKHHDGFAMYPSKVSPYNITLTKFKRDPMRELRDACTRYGLKFGFYYSHAYDWEDPDAPGNDWEYNNPGGSRKLGGVEWWKGPRADFIVKARRYVDQKAIPQIKELIAMYHPDILWFDTPSKLPPEENFCILAAVRAADPHVVVNGRLVREYGDYKNTADRPAEIPYTDGQWEGIPTTNESYGWSRIDHSHKPPAHFIVLLAKSVSKGGNMLLNVGPMGNGEIDPADVAILHGIGAWMHRNSESIYGCDRTPLAVQNWGTSTWNPATHTLYLHVFHWPTNGRLLVGGLGSDPLVADLLANPAAGSLPWRRVTPEDLELSVPAAALDRADTVIRLRFGGPITANFARYIPATEPTTLHVMDGHLAGKGIRYGDGKRNNDCTLEWRSPAGGVDWPLRLTVPVRLRVALNYATATRTDGGTFVISAEGRRLQGTVEATTNPIGYRSVPTGELDLPAGTYTLTIRPVRIEGTDLMKLRQIELTPEPVGN